MSTYRAIDVVVFPFTPDTKKGPYSDVKVLKDSMVHLGIWDNEFTAEALVHDMDQAGVERVLICAQAAGSWEVSYEYIEEMVRQFPTRLQATAGIDPRDIAGGVRKLETAVRDRSFVGGHSYPHWFGLAPDDPAYYPFYYKCIELDVPVQIQVGMAYQAGLRNVGHPAAIEHVAVDLPELKIIGIHTGHPWAGEMVAVAWKHPNVYIGADLISPSAWAPELVDFIRGPGMEKVLWGTNKPVLEFEASLAEVDALGLEDDVKQALLYDNVKRVYGW